MIVTWQRSSDLVLRQRGAGVRLWAVVHEEGKTKRLFSSTSVSLETDLPGGHAWLLRSTESVLSGVPDMGTRCRWLHSCSSSDEEG